MLSGDEWMNNLRSEGFWRRGQAGGSAGKAAASATAPQAGPAPFWDLFGGPQGMPLELQQRHRQFQSSGFRTVCVRLCDGYFFPISFSTTRDRFPHDEDTCQSRCSSPAKLYVYRNPGQDPEDMVDMDGRPYSNLRTAFLFRTTYDASCKCNAHPWEPEAQLRHRIYALEAQRGKGNRVAAAELKELRAAQAAEARAQKQITAAALPLAGAAVKAAGDDDEEDARTKQKSRSGGQRVAYGDRAAPKGAMRLGAGGSSGQPPSAPSRGGSDWKKSVFSSHN